MSDLDVESWCASVRPDPNPLTAVVRASNRHLAGSCLASSEAASSLVSRAPHPSRVSLPHGRVASLMHDKGIPMENETGNDHGHGGESSQGAIEQPRGSELAPHAESPSATRSSHGLHAGPSGTQEQGPAVQELRSDVRAKMLLVLAAMHALPSNGRTVTASVRELQKKTGFSRGAAARAIHRCVEVGWIQPTGNRRKSAWWRAADSYRLLTPAPTLPSWLWSAHGLGATAFLLFDATPTHEATSTKEIAATADVSMSTAQRYLKRLLSLGLVDKPTRGCWIRLDDPDYFTEAERFLTHEPMIKRIRWIREEQAEFKAFDDWIQEKGKPLRVGHSQDSQPARLRDQSARDSSAEEGN